MNSGGHRRGGRVHVDRVHANELHAATERLIRGFDLLPSRLGSTEPRLVRYSSASGKAPLTMAATWSASLRLYSSVIFL